MNVQKLTPKQAAFVREYLKVLNATQAAIKAGYSAKTAASIGDENLRKPVIKAALQSAMDARAKRTEIEADYVLRNLVEIGERCMQKAPVMAYDRSVKAMAQVQDAEGRDVWEFDAQGALKAQELLGKHLRLFTDKVELTGKDGTDLFGPDQIVRMAQEIQAAKGGKP